MPSQPPKVALLLPNLMSGGAERITVYLANALAERGYPVDLLLLKAEGPFLPDVGKQVRVVDLQVGRVVRAIPRLARYLRSARPDVLLSALDHINVGAILARRLSRTATPLIAAVHITHSEDAAHHRGIKNRILRSAIKRCYRRADAIVCVSHGVAEDLRRTTEVEEQKVRVIYNPVITQQMLNLSREPVSHPWFAPGEPATILAVGRLWQQKDFATLLRAFALLRKECDLRLMILGDGPERSRLEALARELQLTPRVLLPGFVDNPYAYLARAALFVLSSAWEALPTVLIEALAVGVPVVATDCPHGPREILGGGQYGRLVPVGDAQALAQAMSDSLAARRSGVPPEALRRYTLDFAVDQYCRLISELLRE
jgi:glycosyltransferase involved in cell wall biosynthesis